ncbi:MAG: M16 family metallopeptidase [Terriglobia bacterium]
MRFRCLIFAVAFLLGEAATSAAQQSWRVPTAVKKLPNGLIVVVSEDHSAPTFGLCITYGIGFRLEPEGRTGFAHLFEHMMFEGTPDAPKGTFDRVIEGGGGSLNGFTRFDFTAYYDTAPVSALEPVLWLEADRLKTLDFSEKNLDNQRNVVQEEVRVNVLNQPYGAFYWLDLPQKAFDRYPNAHNFYGDFKDLDAAKIEDVKAFFDDYYAPNNAVLAIAGDLQPEDAFAKVEKYFGAIPSRQVPSRPDVSEPPQNGERRFTQEDSLATVPALAVGYRMPPRSSHEAIVGAVVAEILHNGQASRLYQALVKDKEVALEVSGGVNWPLGNAFDYNGPVLLSTFMVYPTNRKESDVLSAYDAVIADLARQGPAPAELDRIRTKMRSDWYAQLEIPSQRAVTLACTTLFDGNPQRVNEIPDELARVTAEEIKAFAAKYLVPAHRTIINRVPAAKNAEKGGL